MNIQRRRRPNVSQLRRITRPARLALAISAAVGGVLPATAWAQAYPANSNIEVSDANDLLRPGRATRTTVNKTGAIGAWVFDIASTTTKNGTDFNSFNHFVLAQGDTVNFNLAQGSSNVVNLVWDSRAFINGTVNSYLTLPNGNGNGNGNPTSVLGGNVFFADPHGIVVGANAVMNVGSLSLSTPSQSEMTALAMGGLIGGLDTDNSVLTAILMGREKIGSGDTDGDDYGCASSICVSGQVFARSAVRIRAAQIDIDGSISTTGTGGASDFLATAVNLDDASAVIDANTIRVMAEQADATDGGFTSVAAKVNMSGTLTTAAGAATGTAPASAVDTWGNVDLSAAASASVDYGTPAITAPAGTAEIGDVWRERDDFAEHGLNATVANASIATAEKGIQVAVVRAAAQAEVTVSGTIKAGGDVSIASSTEASATTDAASLAFKPAAGSSTKLPMAVTVVYGGLDSRATTDVTSTAKISGNNVSVTASTDNTLEISASTRVGIGATQSFASTVAISQAKVDASVNMAGQVTSNSLTVDATNANDFTTQAATFSDDGAIKAGLVAAFSDTVVNANATLGNNAANATNVIGAGGVIVNATTHTGSNQTTATNMLTPEWMKLQEPSVSNKQTVNAGANLTGTLGQASGRMGSGIFDALPFKVGAALSWTDSDQHATARVGEGAKVETSGNTSVTGTVVDEKIHGGAHSAMIAKTQGGATPDVVISAAVNYGNYTHDAVAEVGRNAQITAANIGVQSFVNLPFDWTFGFAGVADMGQDLDAFQEGAMQLASVVSATGNPLVSNATGYAAASTPAIKDAQGNDVQGEVGISGSVNYTEFRNNSHAWIGEGARLTSTASTATDDGWTVQLQDGTEIDWRDSIQVSALTTANVFSLIGEVRPWEALKQSGKVAAGGAFNYTGQANRTVAGIAADAVVTTNGNDVGVNALSKSTLFAISPIAGKGDAVSLEGVVALSDFHDVTHASVSAGADVSARKLSIDAHTPLTLWSIAGAVALSKEAAIGVSIGINKLDTDTAAVLGDNRNDAPYPSAATAAQTGGRVVVDALDVNARTSGQSGSISVAGAVSKAQDQGPTSGAQKSGGADKMLKLVKKVSGILGTLQMAVDTVDAAKQVVSPDDPREDGSMLGSASEFLGQASEGVAKVGAVADKVQGIAGKVGQSTNPPAGPSQPQSASFGLGVSGAATVNMANIGTRAELQGANVSDRNGTVQATVQAVNTAALISAAGAVSLKLGKSGSGGGSGANIGGAVAYSKIADTTRAWIDDSKLTNASNVAVRALDGSLQVGIGVGAAVNTSNDQGSVTLAGSVSVAQTRNTVEAGISDSELDAGSGGTDPRSLEVVAYDHSRIGTGAGALSFSASTSNNGAALGLTYADIANRTSASISGHVAGGTTADIRGYNHLGVQALDSSLIASGVLSGSVSNGNSNALSGAFIWNSAGNTSSVELGGGVRLDVDGDIRLRAASVESDVDSAAVALQSIMNRPADAYGYDFEGTSLAYTGATPATGGDADQPQQLDLGARGWGSSIIAVAGSVSAGGNNVGVSFVGGKVENAHSVTVGNASLDAAGDLSLEAFDSTRIIGVAVGAGVTTGRLAGAGSVTYNEISNTSLVDLGGGLAAGEKASLTAANITANAGDASRIYTLAGGVAVGTGNAAGAGAVTVNTIDNQVGVSAGSAEIVAVPDAPDPTQDGQIAFDAASSAQIMSGAVAGAGAVNAALALSFGWNETSNDVFASGGAGTHLSGRTLGLRARNDSDIYTLSGSVAIGGTTSPAGAISVADIHDSSRTVLAGSTLGVTDRIALESGAEGDIYSLAVGIAGGGKGTISGSLTYATIDNEVSANASNLVGVNPADSSNPNQAVRTGVLGVSAANDAAIRSLALSGAGASHGSAAVAVSVGDIGGKTQAVIRDTVLGVSQETRVIAEDASLIRTAAAGGALAAGSLAASNSTNLIHNQISAEMSNVGTDAAIDGSQLDRPYVSGGNITLPDGSTQWSAGEPARLGQVSSTNATTIRATNSARIDSLAGGVSLGGLGGAVAVNRIATTNDAAFSGNGNGDYRVRSLLVEAGASNPGGGGSPTGANINTISVSAAVGSQAVAGSLSINMMDATNTARIAGGAQVIADHDAAVLASNAQGINVLAGSVGVGDASGVGAGVVVNHVAGSTRALIDSSEVTAYGNGSTGIQVDSGEALNGASLDAQIDIRAGVLPALFAQPAEGSAPNLTGTGAPDLSGVKSTRHGVVVNALNTQHIATLGVGAAVSSSTAVAGQVGVNIVGGTTEALINASKINKANEEPNGQIAVSPASSKQGVDVRATSRQHQFSRLFEVAGSGNLALGAGVLANVFNADTRAGINQSAVSAAADTQVIASGEQWSMAGVSGLGVSAGVAGGAASVAVNVTQTQTEAFVSGGALLVGSLGVHADARTSSSLVGGALGVGLNGAGIAGVVLVNVNEADTRASIRDGARVSATGTDPVADGSVNVTAESRNQALSAGAGGGVGQYAGVAGVASINVIGNHTHADVDGATVGAQTLAVTAKDVQDVDSRSGALGGGQMFGAGGGLNLVLLQSSVGAQVNASDVTTRGDIDVRADSDRTIASQAAALGAGAVGVGLSVGVIVAGTGDISNGGEQDAGANLRSDGQVNTDNATAAAGEDRVSAGTLASLGATGEQIGTNDISAINAGARYDLGAATGSGGSAAFGRSDGIQANILGGNINATGSIEVAADAHASTRNTTGAVAAGGVSLGGSIAYSSINTRVGAKVDSANLTARNGLDISAAAGDGSDGAMADSFATAGVGGLVGLGAAVSISRIDNQVSAELGGTAQGSNQLANAGNNVVVRASDTGSASAGNDSPSVSVGGVVAGAVVVRANRESDVSARLLDNARLNGFHAATIDAASGGKVTASAAMGSGGVGASGVGVDARADDSSTVRASIGQAANLGNTTDVQVKAAATPQADAAVRAVSVAGGASVGVSIARADVNATVEAVVGSGAVFGNSELDVLATLDAKSDARAKAATGGIALSIASADARASNDSDLTARVDSGVALPKAQVATGDTSVVPTSGNVVIKAIGNTTQTADASGISVGGVLAVGNVLSKSTSNVTTSAMLGDGNGTLQTLGTLEIAALGTDRNDASSSAGGGALVSGNGSDAVTDSTSTTTASLGKQLNLAVDSLGLRAEHEALYGGTADSINVGLIGGSGAAVRNAARSHTLASVGDGSKVNAGGNILIGAKSRFGSDDKNAGATGGSGGIFAGASAKVDTSLAATNEARLGQGVQLGAGLTRGLTDNATIDIVAATTTTALNDQASQTVAGAVPIAASEVTLSGDFKSDVNIGNDSRLNSSDRVNVATYAGIDNMGSQALANTVGLGTVATAKSTIDLRSNQNVRIGDRVHVFGAGEVDVVAGRDVRNIQNTRFAPTASAQAYARGVIAVPAASAKATVDSNANMVLGTGSSITSGDDVAVGSTIGQSSLQVDGTGHGYQLGFIPVTQHSSTQRATGVANTVLHGSVLAGKFNKVRVNIDSTGAVSTSGSTAPIFVLQSNGSPLDYLRGLIGPYAQIEGFEDVSRPIYTLSGSPLPGTPIAVSGGNVHLFGSSVSGNGSVVANGAPSVDVSNASTGYLFLPAISTNFGKTGQVFLSGGALMSNLGGVTVQSAPDDATPTISIKSSYPSGGAAKPGIAIIGDVTNLGGSVDIETLAGSFHHAGSIRANAVNLNVPSGVVTIDGGSGNIMAGTSPESGLSTWLGSFANSFINNPDYAAAAIAQYMFYGHLLNPANPLFLNETLVNQGLLTNNLNWSSLNTFGSQTFAVPATGTATNSPLTERTPVILYGNCAAYTNQGADGCYSKGTAGTWGASFIPSDEGRFANFVPYVPLWQAGMVPSSAATSSWTAEQLVVKAGTININAPINVGTAATWTVQTTDALKHWIDQNRTGTTPIRIPQYGFDPSGSYAPFLKIVDAQGYTRLIGATFDPVSGRIILDNVNAAGNGSATFEGNIVSTGAGTIRVNSGYGSVTVQNDSGTPLVVNNIFAGNGGQGVVQFVDKLKTDAQGRALRTWYVSDNGGPARMYTNAANRSLTSLEQVKTQSAGTLFGTSSTYQPLQGMQYVWGSSLQVTRGDNPANDWAGFSSSGGTVGLKWSTPTGSYRLQTDGAVKNAHASGSAPKTLGQNDYVAVLTGDFDWLYDNASGKWIQPFRGSAVHYHGCDDGRCHYGTNQTNDGTGPDNDGDTSPHSRWLYIYPMAGSLNLTVTQKADKPIAVQFATSQSSHVTLGSNADIYLNGLVSNTHGPTYINATNGASIIQANQDALVWTHELSMSATGGGRIGSKDNPILASIVHDNQSVADRVPIAIPTNALLLETDGGDISVNVDSGSSDQAVLVSASDGAGRNGDVRINATGSIVGLDAAGRAVVANSTAIAPFSNTPWIFRAPSQRLKDAAAAGIDVVGSDIRLTSQFGSIGSLAAPLNVEARGDTRTGALIGVVDAHAYQDIALVNRAGNLWLGGNALDADGNWDGGIVAEHGDVWLSSPEGGIYDARSLVSGSTLTPSQAEAAWAKLHLTDGNALDGVIAGINASVNTAYMLYWQLMDAGSVDAAGAYTLSAGSIPVYFRLAAAERGIDPASVSDPAAQALMAQEFASARFGSVTTAFETHIGADWNAQQDFRTRNLAYQFSVDTTSGKYLDLINDSRWKENQLKYAINILALGTPTAGQVGAAPANVSGANVTLLAGNGGIGRTVAPLDVDYVKLRDGTHTAQEGEALALALAGAHSPGDAILLDANRNVLALDNPDLASKLKWISLRQTSPLYVDATGSLAGNASGSVYLQSNGDMHLAGLVAGTDIRLSAAGSIDAATGHAPGTPVLTAGRDATLNAGSGHISFGNGTASTQADPLPVQVNGTLLSAAAKTDLLLSQMSGDLRIGTAFANNLVYLAAPTGSILGMLSDLSVVGHDISLLAGGDIQGPDAGGTAGPLQVQVAPDGLINATARGAVNLASPDFAMHIGTIDAGSDIKLASPNSGVDAQTLISRAGSVDIVASGDVQLGRVEAQTGIVAATTAALAAGTLVATTGDVTLEAIRAMTLDNVVASGGNIDASASAPTATFTIVDGGALTASGDVNLTSGGTLTMGAGSQVDAGTSAMLATGGDMLVGNVSAGATTGTAINLQSGGRIQGNGDAVNLVARGGGSTQVDAQAGIGTQAQPFVVDVARLSGSSANGSVWLHMLGDINIPSFSVPNGDLHATGTQAVDFDRINVDGTAYVVGSQVTGNTLDATDAMVGASGSVAINTVNVGNGLNVDAGTSIDVGTLQVGGNAALTAGSTALLGVLNVGGALAAASGGDAHLVNGTVGGTSTFDAGGDLIVDTFVGGDSVTSTSLGNTTLGRMTLTGGDLASTAGRDLSIDTLDVLAGHANLASGAAMQISTANVSGDLMANAGSSLAATRLQVGGNGTLNAGTDAHIDTLNVGGLLALQSGGNTRVTAANVGGTSKIDSGADLVLDAFTGGDSVVTTSVGNTKLGHMTLTGGDLASTAGRDLSIDTLDVQAGHAHLASGAAMRIGTVNVSDDFTANAGSSLAATWLDIGGSARLDAGTTLDVTRLDAGANANLVSNDDMTFGDVTAGIDLTGTSHAGSITGTTAVAGRDLSLTAQGNVTVQTMQARRDIRVDSGAAISVGEATAGRNLALAGQQVDFGQLAAPNQIDLLARDDSIVGNTLATLDAYIAASDDIRLNAAYIGNRINMQATNIMANLYQTGSNPALYSVLTGYRGAVAESIVVNADVPQHWNIDVLAANTARFTTTSPKVSILDGTIIHTMELDTSKASIRMNQDDPRLVQADVQLMEPDHAFQLYQDGVRTRTDAYVIRYGFGYEIDTPNFVMGHGWNAPDYLGESVLRYNGRHLSARNGLFFDEDGNLVLLQWQPSSMLRLVDPAATPVNLH